MMFTLNFPWTIRREEPFYRLTNTVTFQVTFEVTKLQRDIDL